MEGFEAVPGQQPGEPEYERRLFRYALLVPRVDDCSPFYLIGCGQSFWSIPFELSFVAKAGAGVEATFASSKEPDSAKGVLVMRSFSDHQKLDEGFFKFPFIVGSLRSTWV